MQRRILSANGVGDRIFEVARALPLARRTDMTVAADLVDAPVDFEAVIVRIAEFDSDLTAGATAAGKIDLRTVPK